MDNIIDSIIMFIDNLALPISLNTILSNHIIPIISNVLVMGFIWIVASIFLYFYTRDKRVSILIIIGLFLCSIVGNEVMKPVLFHFREFLSTNGVGIYLPEIGRYTFPSGYIMMCASSTVLIYYTNKQFGLYALCITGLVAFLRLYIITTYPVDFFIGLGLGIIIGAFLVLFLMKKKKEYEEIEDLSDKFHF